ncbi:MAG: carbon-nitrogen hydrolase family protein [Albidovulum sp.]|nr:carbon-nitrogen hydrolase family protein [Albidovulum sp.]
MRKTLRISILQMNSSNRHRPNVATVAAAASLAGSENADLLALPEASGLMNRVREEARHLVSTEELDPYIAACRELASKFRIWIHLGSTPVADDSGRYRNRSLLIDNQGSIRARYDKIHLFDVFLPDRPPTGESKRYDPGTDAVLVDTPWGLWGLSICYDLRFPHLYRDYARRGATLMFAPSAFTVPTGTAHWEILLRSRAIENGSWIVAPAQVGKHDDGRITYGHSMIVSPWGEVAVDLGGSSTGQATAELDLEAAVSARNQIPSLKNAREYSIRRVDARHALRPFKKLQTEEVHA